TVGFTGTGNLRIDHSFSYSSPHAFSVLTAGDFYIEGVVQNTGTGAINIIAGWDGHTVDPAHFTDAGVYGNNDGSVFISGSDGSAAIGSFGGTTTVAGADITLEADNGFAQIGFNGAGTGNIVVDATGQVTLAASTDSECSGCYAQIGNGGVYA